MQSSERALLLWEKLEKALGIEISSATEPEEVKRAVGLVQVPFLAEEIGILDEMSAVGYSNIRTDRIIYSIVITGIYAEIVEKDPSRVKEIEEYLEERMKDVNKTVRNNCIRFIMRYPSSIAKFCTRKIPRIMINLLKNKNRSVRKMHFRIISANTDAFFMLLRDNDGKILLNTLSLVLKHQYFTKKNLVPHKPSFFADRAFEIACSALAHGKASMSEIGVFLSASFSLEELISGASAKILSKTLSDEMIKDTFLSGLIEKEKNKSPVTCAAYILRWSILHRKAIFNYYTNLFRSGNINLEMQCRVLSMLINSPYQKNKYEYTPWIESQIENLDDSSSCVCAQTLIKMYISLFSEAVKEEDSLSSNAFYQHIEKAFCISAPARNEIIFHFEIMASKEKIFKSLLCKLSFVVVHNYPDLYTKLVQSINIFSYLDIDSVIPLINHSNPTNYYILLWYTYLLKKEDKIHSEIIETVSKIKIQPILHADIELSTDFFTLLSLMQKPTVSNSFFSNLLVSMQKELSSYLTNCLCSARKSREALLSSFSDISHALYVLLSPAIEDSSNNLPILSFLSHPDNAGCVHTLLLYFLNSDELFNLLTEYLSKICPRVLLPISSADIDRLREYGILSQKTEKRYQKYLSLVKPLLQQNAEVSSLVEKTVSTNLDTNIIENISQIEDLHTP